MKIFSSLNTPQNLQIMLSETLELELVFMHRTDTLVLIAKFIVNHILINILPRSQAHNITTRHFISPSIPQHLNFAAYSRT